MREYQNSLTRVREREKERERVERRTAVIGLSLCKDIYIYRNSSTEKSWWDFRDVIFRSFRCPICFFSFSAPTPIPLSLSVAISNQIERVTGILYSAHILLDFLLTSLHKIAFRFFFLRCRSYTKAASQCCDSTQLYKIYIYSLFSLRINPICTGTRNI